MTGEHHDGHAALEPEGLLRTYSRLPGEEPPRDIDAAILAAARDAVRPRRAGARRWWLPVSIAATALLALSVVLEVRQETGGNRMPEVDVPPARTEGATSANGSATPSPPPAAEIAAPPYRPAVADQARESLHGSPPPQAAPARAAPAGKRSGETSEAVSPASGHAASPASGEPLASPEEWLARIEALERDGRTLEAEHERAALESAYPGWLAEQGSTPQ